MVLLLLRTPDSNGGDGFPDATSEDHDDAAIYSELVSGRFSLITKRQGLSDSNNGIIIIIITVRISINFDACI